MPIQIGHDNLQTLEIWHCGYCARCAVPGCRSLARIVLRRVAQGGGPEAQTEHCYRHARKSITKARRGWVQLLDMR
jgi:hypothetical protein